MSPIESGWSQPPEPVEVPHDVPRENLLVYSRLYQFERWLREMVYLELFAAYGFGWEKEFESRVGNKARRAAGARERDKNLTHMATKESRVLAYSDLGDLFAVIYDDSKREVDKLFAPYFPPGSVLGGKLQEVLSIRLRTMHARSLHSSDLARMVQFLTDIDQGFWRWCTSYNAYRVKNVEAVEDPIGKRYADRDPHPQSGFALDLGGYQSPVGMTIHYSPRPWAQTPGWRREPLGKEGWLYHVCLFGNRRSERRISAHQFLESSRSLHPRLLYAHIGDDIEIVLPRVASTDELIEIIEALYDIARNCAFRRDPGPGPEPREYERLVRGYGENILGPESPLSFLEPAMPCSWFGLDLELPPFDPASLLSF